jgi:hypothetical protein
MQPREKFHRIARGCGGQRLESVTCEPRECKGREQTAQHGIHVRFTLGTRHAVQYGKHTAVVPSAGNGLLFRGVTVVVGFNPAHRNENELTGLA